MTERIVIVSDIQYPYHDPKNVKAVIKYIIDTQPDEVVFIGDQLDFPQPSRWSKDTRAEFEGSVYEDAEGFQEDVIKPLRAGYSKRVGMHRGNHDERPMLYLEKYAPALAGRKQFNMETLLDFEKYDIALLPDFYDVAPGWMTTHGHMGKISLSQIAGNTALNAARKFGRSVAMGHTHRMGIGSFTHGYDGDKKNEKIVTGMEVGNLMDMKQAAYLKGGSANWQSGFGLLTVDGTHVKPELVPISKGRFIVDGRSWEV